jgi:hypothetical protein
VPRTAFKMPISLQSSEDAAVVYVVDDVPEASLR